MKRWLLLILAAVLLTGCGDSKPAAQTPPREPQESPAPIAPPPSVTQEPSSPIAPTPGPDENLSPEPAEEEPENAADPSVVDTSESTTSSPIVRFQFATPSGEPEPGEIDEISDNVLSEASIETLPDLIALLTHRNPDVRREAAVEIAALQQAAASAVDPLRKLLRDPNKYVRMTALYALAQIGEPAAPAIPDVARALCDPDRYVALQAVDTLAVHGEEAAFLIPQLIVLMENEQYRFMAISALGNIGPASKPQAAAIIEHHMSDFGTRSASAKALAKMGIYKPLLERLEIRLMMDYIEALGEVRPMNEEVVDALVKCLESDDKYIRGGALTSLGNARPTNERIVSVLIESLHSDDSHDRADAAKALGEIEPKLASAAPALLSALKDDEKKVREVAMRALLNYSFDDKDFLIAVLAAASDGGNRRMRKKLAESKETVIPILLDIVKDQQADPNARAMAIDFVRSLQEGRED